MARKKSDAKKSEEAKGNKKENAESDKEKSKLKKENNEKRNNKERRNYEKRVTKYEISRVIGARALEIASGAPFFVDLSEEELKQIKYNPIKIAEIEFKEGVLPIAVKDEE